jgi:DNA-directed RNA polymerase subunit M/transcription elongation factor TFIIS
MTDNIIKLKNTPRRSIQKLDYVAEKINASEVPTKSVIDFTCPTCYNHTKFTFERMVFKTLQFFCAKCGTGWKVGNPMFVSKDKDSSEPK